MCLLNLGGGWAINTTSPCTCCGLAEKGYNPVGSNSCNFSKNCYVNRLPICLIMRNEYC